MKEKLQEVQDRINESIENRNIAEMVDESPNQVEESTQVDEEVKEGWSVFDEPKKEVKKKLRFKTVFEMAAYNDDVINKHFRPIFRYIANRIFIEVRQSLIQEAVLSGSHTPTDVFNELIKGALNGDALNARKTWRYLLLKSFDCLPYSLVELEGDLRLGTIRTLNNNIRKVDGLKEFPAGMLKGMPYHLSRAEILLLGSPFENLDRVVLELNSIIESDSFFIES